MTMHLVGAYLTTTGKKKGKKKFRNAEEARRARELEESWTSLQKKWGVGQPKKNTIKPKAEKLSYSLTTPPGRETKRIESKGTGVGVATAAQPNVYTGTLIKGVSQMHKSNLVPVLDESQIKDIARMRR